jgi:hypothetical protein
MPNNNKLIKRIEALIAKPVEPEWPTLSPEQVAEFRQIVYDLANAAFAPDYKDRSVLDISIVDSKRYTVHTFFESRDIDLYDPEIPEGDFYRAFSDLNRTATMMISTGSRLLDRVGDIAGYRAQRVEKEAETASDIDGLRKLLEKGDFAAFEVERDRLIDKFDPVPREGSNYRKITDELQIIIDEYGLKLSQAVRQAAIDEITPYLDRAEALVGNDHRTNGGYEGSFDEASEAAREALYKHRYRIGGRVLAPVNVRFNRMSDEHRVIVRFRERGLKVVPETEVA